MMTSLNLSFSESAKERIERFMATLPDGQALALIQSGTPGPNGEWGIGSYEIDKIEAVESQYRNAGYSIRFIEDGVSFVVEPHFAVHLKNRRMDFEHGRFIVKGQSNGT